MATPQQKTTYSAAEVAALEETILKLKTENDELRRKLEHMNEVFANAQRARFGQSSEKNSYVLHDQASFFNEAEKEQAPKAEEPTPDTILVFQHERKKKRNQAEMLNGLPEDEVLLELPEDQLVCSKCGGKMKPIGKKFLCHEMMIIPKQMKLLGPRQTKMAGSHAGGRNGKNQQSRRWLPILQQVVCGGAEMRCL